MRDQTYYSVQVDCWLGCWLWIRLLKFLFLLCYLWLVSLKKLFSLSQFSLVQSLSNVRLFVTPWTAAHQASLSITNSQSLLKLMSIYWWCHLTISSCHPLLLLLSIFPDIRVFSNESVLCIRWSKYWSFSIKVNWKWSNRRWQEWTLTF